MDDVISARFAELHASAAETKAGAGVRQDMLEENWSANLALGGSWDDPTYHQKMADQQYNYNLYTEDNACNLQIGAHTDNTADEFAAMQARCMGGYAR